MINKKHAVILVIFLLGSVVIMYSAINFVRIDEKNMAASDEVKEDFSSFRGLDYFLVSNNEKEFRLQSEDLIQSLTELSFKSPKGTIYSGDNLISYAANDGVFTQKNKILNLNGEVSFVSSKGLKHESDKITYDSKKNYLEATGNTKSDILNNKSLDRIIINSNSMKSWLGQKLMKFGGNINARLIRKRTYEGEMKLKASYLEFNQLKSLISMAGDVSLSRNRYYLHANKADMFLENFNKSLKYYVLYDDIKLEEKLLLSDGTVSLRRAFSEKLEGYMKENKIVLSGAPRVEQDGDLIKGYQITLRENVELVEVDDSQTRFNIERAN